MPRTKRSHSAVPKLQPQYDKPPAKQIRSVSKEAGTKYALCGCITEYYSMLSLIYAS